MEMIDNEKVREIAEKHGLRLLVLFGSQANGKKHKFSDFDFGFICDKENDYKKRGELEHDLAKLIHCKFVEVVDLKKASPFLLKEVVRNNKVFFEKEFAYEDFFSYAVRTHLYANKLFELQEKLYLQTVNKYKQKMYAE